MAPQSVASHDFAGRPISVGILGLGHMGRRHCELLSHMPGVRIVAVADSQEEARGAAARRWPGSGIEVLETAEQMLNGPHLDALFVCTPPGHHADPAVAALSDGTAVYVEKPLARTLEQGERIVAAQKEDVPAAVGYQWRAIPFLADLAAEVAGSSLGLLVSRSIGAGLSRAWFEDWAASGGILYELASHDVDLQRALGGAVVAVQAELSNPAVSDAATPGFQSVLALALRFGSGALGSISVASTRSVLPGTWALDVVGADGVLHLTLDPAFELRGTWRGRDVTAKAERPPLESSVAAFVRAVQTGKPDEVCCSLAEGLETLAVLDACELALRTGERTPVRRKAILS
jgi:myo-inositol 2-dehydrogenase / D-chiro-inositol 1-dehydrogenase